MKDERPECVGENTVYYALYTLYCIRYTKRERGTTGSRASASAAQALGAWRPAAGCPRSARRLGRRPERRVPELRAGGQRR